jgi:hypothetical protein
MTYCICEDCEMKELWAKIESRNKVTYTYRAKVPRSLLMSEPKWHRVCFTADLFFVERPEISREEASKLIY